MARSILLAILIIASASSCFNVGGKRVKGNGNITVDERSVQAFEEVDVQGAIDVYVEQGSLAPVRVETDENLQEYIKVENEGGKLVVKSRSGYNLKPSKKTKIYLTSPTYRKLDVSGACNIISSNKLVLQNPLALEVSGAGDIRVEVSGPEVSAKVSGSGDIDMKGETQNFDLRISGAGDAKCYDLLSENTKVDISGAGSAEVFASVMLKAEVSGAGSIKYKGNAANVSKNVSGAGSVKKAE
jgi:Putative auto-transporter adhesin, head GIN domain